MTKQMNLFIALIISIPLFLHTSCAVNPVTGENQLMLLSEQEEVQIGQQYAPEIRKQMEGSIQNSRLQNYINTVGQKIARASHRPDLPFFYEAVEYEQANAMALPGGPVFITRGLLELIETEEQLAAILAHETAHITARHSAQMISQQIGVQMVLSAVSKGGEGAATAAQVAGVGAQILSLKYSRDFEKQADAYGMDYLNNSGYPPHAMIEVMEKLESISQSRPLEFFSTHPSPENRKELLLERIAEKNYIVTPSSNTQSYKQYVLENL